MPRIMVDASAWIALFHRRDQHHADALALFPQLAEDHDLWTTGPFAFEAHKRLSQDRTAGPWASSDFAREMAAGRLAVISPPGSMPSLEETAAAWLHGLSSFSLEDVSGVLAMRNLGIRTIWAWDDDFGRLGVRVLP